MAWIDGPRFDSDLTLIEPEVGLAGGLVGPMTGEAVFREDGANIAVELDLAGCGVCDFSTDNH
jgi:hypothetical protein